MNWYKRAQQNDINIFRDALFNTIINNVSGDWTPRKFKYFKSHISAGIDGTSTNNIGTKTGYFDIRLTIFLINNTIGKIICSVYGKEFKNEYPKKDWMTQRMFSDKHKEIEDISEDVIYTIEEIPSCIQNAINKFFGNENDFEEETDPNISPVKDINYELV